MAYIVIYADNGVKTAGPATARSRGGFGAVVTGERKVESRRVARHALGPHVAAVRFDQTACDVESEAEPRHVVRALRSAESREDARELLAGDAAPVVHDPEPHVVADLSQLHADATCPVTVFHRVAHEIAEDLLESVAVDVHRLQSVLGGHRDVAVRREVLQMIERFMNELCR